MAKIGGQARISSRVSAQSGHFRRCPAMSYKSSNAQNAYLCLPFTGYRHRLGRLMLHRGRPSVCRKWSKKMTPLKTISEKLTAWRRYREAVRELSQLSDRELDDIGIRRGDIEFIVRRSVASQASA